MLHIWFANGSRPCLLVWASLLMLPIALVFAEPPQAPLTAEQRVKLKERNRLSKEANRLQREGKLAEAIAAAEKMLALERQVLGDVHGDVVESLEWLAGMHEQRDDFAAARQARQEVLTLRIKLHGAEHWRVTDARLYLAEVESLSRMTAAQRQQLAEANRLNDEVVAFYRQGRFREAVEKAQQVVEIRKQALGEKHPAYATSLNNLALLYSSQSDYAQAEPLYRQALAIRKQALGANHPFYASSLNNLASLYKSQSNYAQAEPLFRQALTITKQALGEKHRDYALSLNNLAVLYDDMGDYAKAEPLYRQASEVYKQAMGAKHPDYAVSLNNLAVLYTNMGDYAKAEPLCQKALEIHKQALGAKHPDNAYSLNNLAELYSAQGDYAKAEPLYRQASEVFKQALGAKHPDYAVSLSNLAVLYLSQGDYARAESHGRQALEITKQALSEKHPVYANILQNLARLYRFQGDYTQAETLYRQALAIRRQALGEKHSSYALSLNQLAALYGVQGKYAQAEPLCQQALTITRDNLELAATVQSQRQQLAMLQNLRSSLDAYLSLASQARATVEQQYRPMLAWKGTVGRRQRQQRLARQRPELAKDFAVLNRVSCQLATLAFAVPDPKQQEARRRKLQDLTDEKERLEGQLAGRSAVFRKEQELRNLEPAQLQAALPADAVLLDFLEYTHYSPSAEKKGQWKTERRLVAFVVRRDALERVDLGPASAVKKALDDWRLALQRHFRTEGDDALGAAVRQLLWQPLEKHLHGAKVVLVSPDGDLARVPFAALPGSKKDSYLLEERAIAVVPVPQLLPELLTPRPVTGKDEPSLMLVGDVDYGAAPGSAADAVVSHTAPRPSRQSTLAAAKPLPGTRAEILAVRDSFEERFPNGQVKMLRKAQATEDAIRQQAPRHRYLHLATHGFFAPKDLRDSLAGVSRGKESAAANLFERRGVAGFHPGLLSGLVLAGANQPVDPAKDDGILTALEVEALDLTGVELTTLSACETGLGETAGGEGLLGLQRAFQVAGARSVAASLWTVDDKATRDLMTRFYENLWQKKLPKLEALRQAQLWMLAEGSRAMIDVKVPRERLAKEDGRLPPYYWAAFVLSGDWR
jgi:CHAT domain-containing protein